MNIDFWIVCFDIWLFVVIFVEMVVNGIFDVQCDEVE